MIEPSFSDFIYAVDYAPQPKDCLTPRGGTLSELEKVEHLFCRDVLVTYRMLAQEQYKGVGAPRQWTFHIPVEEWRAFAEGLDQRLDGWQGRKWSAADGTTAAVERIRDGRIRSVVNNIAEYEAPLNPAYFAQTETQRLLLLFGPSGIVPRTSNWTVRKDGDPDWPCSSQQFATPDPDGWGIGEDRCARWLKERRR
ncbi:MAG: hypothetical protein J7498_14755 [Sphingobium sp.]|nr:hypothetical protein [Sphingobium sp.]